MSIIDPFADITLLQFPTSLHFYLFVYLYIHLSNHLSRCQRLVPLWSTWQQKAAECHILCTRNSKFLAFCSCSHTLPVSVGRTLKPRQETTSVAFAYIRQPGSLYINSGSLRSFPAGITIYELFDCRALDQQEQFAQFPPACLRPPPNPECSAPAWMKSVLWKRDGSTREVRGVFTVHHLRFPWKDSSAQMLEFVYGILLPQACEVSVLLIFSVSVIIFREAVVYLVIKAKKINSPMLDVSLLQNTYVPLLRWIHQNMASSLLHLEERRLLHWLQREAWGVQWPQPPTTQQLLCRRSVFPPAATFW